MEPGMPDPEWFEERGVTVLQFDDGYDVRLGTAEIRVFDDKIELDVNADIGNINSRFDRTGITVANDKVRFETDGGFLTLSL